MQKATVTQYRRYTIRAMPVDGLWRARAFLTGARQGAGIVAEAEDEGETEVIAAVTALLDRREAERAASRRLCEAMGFHVPTAEEYAEALGTTELHPAQQKMLKAHAARGNDGMVPIDLARAAGYPDCETANLHYGAVGTRLADTLKITLPTSSSRDGAPLPTGVLALWIKPEATQEGVGRWVMYPELREAVATLPL